MPLLEQIEIWNRKLHTYTGLYLLLFIWLFSISGLILNHPTWEFAQFWPQREQSSYARTVRVPAEGGDLARTKDLMVQLGISGEIGEMTTYPEKMQFDFRLVRPGRIVDVKTDLKTGRATVEEIETNMWGVLHWLHSFTGVRMNKPEEERDWFATKIWSFSMDAVCVGLFFLVASSLYMWYPLVRKRKIGWIALGAGLLCCGFFVFGLG